MGEPQPAVSVGTILEMVLTVNPRRAGSRRCSTLTGRDTSAAGTFRTWPDVRLESAFGGRADVICSERVFPVLTHLRHWSCGAMTGTRGPFQPPSKVLVFVITIPSPEPGVGHEATRISRCARRCGGVAARGAGADQRKNPANWSFVARGTLVARSLARWSSREPPFKGTRAE